MFFCLSYGTGDESTLIVCVNHRHLNSNVCGSNRYNSNRIDMGMDIIALCEANEYFDMK